jgi:drug/metabolite transporter (DMT)-like permease
MFGETLAPVSIFGMALVVIAVAMVTWKRRPA